MKAVIAVIAVIAAAGLALWAVFTFIVKPANAAATKPPSAQTPAAPPAATPRPTDTTAQRISAGADLIGAIGSAGQKLGLSF